LKQNPVHSAKYAKNGDQERNWEDRRHGAAIF
jgi:hypothetical protein